MSLISVAVATGIVDTGGKFATGVNNTRGTGGKICRRCRWYRWQICRRVVYRRQICHRCQCPFKSCSVVSYSLLGLRVSNIYTQAYTSSPGSQKSSQAGALMSPFAAPRCVNVLLNAYIYRYYLDLSMVDCTVYSMYGGPGPLAFLPRPVSFSNR